MSVFWSDVSTRFTKFNHEGQLIGLRFNDALGEGHIARTNIGRSNSGKYYFECTFTGGLQLDIGVGTKDVNVNTNTRNKFNRRYYTVGYGTKSNHTTSSGDLYTDPLPYVVGAYYTIGVLLDLDNGQLSFIVNGENRGVAFDDINTLGEIYPTVGQATNRTGLELTTNFGTTPFKYGMPKGYISYDETQINRFDNKLLMKSNDNKYHSIRNDMISQYKFEETGDVIIDSSGNNHGTNYGTTSVAGYEGNGRYFNGTSSYVVLPRKLPIGSKSIRFKIKKNSAKNGERVIMTGAANQYGVFIGLNSNGTVRTFGSDGRSISDPIFDVTSITNVCDNNWHEVCLVWDEEYNVVKLFIDNMTDPEMISNLSRKETIESTHLPYVGTNAGSPSYFLEGVIDELEIYHHAIDPMISYNELTSIDTLSEDVFIRYGQNNINNFQNPIKNITSVVKKNNVLDSGKTFTHKIALGERSVDRIEL